MFSACKCPGEPYCCAAGFGTCFHKANHLNRRENFNNKLGKPWFENRWKSGQDAVSQCPFYCFDNDRMVIAKNTWPECHPEINEFVSVSIYYLDSLSTFKKGRSTLGSEESFRLFTLR